jgi:hypothetical protein
VSRTLKGSSPQSNAPGRVAVFAARLALLVGVGLSPMSSAQESRDPVTGFAREPIHVTAWPGCKKVAVSFALFVEEFGLGQGPAYRPDMTTRNPDLVNEAFRQYAIDWGIPRVGRLFRELDVPLTIVLSAEFPGKYNRCGRSSAPPSRAHRSLPTA